MLCFPLCGTQIMINLKVSGHHIYNLQGEICRILDLLLNFCDFSNASVFRDFVGAIRANGGADGPEDIMGGFKVAFNNLHWRSDSCKVAITDVARIKIYCLGLCCRFLSILLMLLVMALNIIHLRKWTIIILLEILLK